MVDNYFAILQVLSLVLFLVQTVLKSYELISFDFAVGQAHVRYVCCDGGCCSQVLFFDVIGFEHFVLIIDIPGKLKLAYLVL